MEVERTWSDSFHEVCSGSALFVFNGVDIICGTALLVYGAYLGLNHFAPTWLFGPILAVGGVLTFTSFLSWCGASSSNGKCLLLLSSYLLILVALAELVLALVILTHGEAINKFLRDHQAELHLTDDELRQFEAHKFFPAYALVALFLMEVLRFCCSSELSRNRERRMFQYHHLGSLRELDKNLINVKKEQEISARYAALKDKYKKKYHPTEEPLMGASGATQTRAPLSPPDTAAPLYV